MATDVSRPDVREMNYHHGRNLGLTFSLLVFRHPTTPHYWIGDPRMIGTASTFKLPEVPVPAPSARPVQRNRSQSLQERTRPTTTTSVLPTCQRVHVMSSAELDEFRRKLRMQTASRRFRKRKKVGPPKYPVAFAPLLSLHQYLQLVCGRQEQSRKGKRKVQELQAELAHLRDIEAQSEQYQQRSVESLQEELHIHEQELASLSEKVQEAVKEELDWVSMSVL
ncbi:hypothetical protein PHYPSEUDO_003597 [Phytophthora pseudosyringae]|uniref:Uncharacterized protein n=1 Tax=Phytophthora pseudosyringae TaxID=221518 RepID=A0A8T1VVE9_9STRA|nr:hypothetical protein PHYPSEUDO_003597 [Phytophthora pseudosyringae]